MAGSSKHAYTFDQTKSEWADYAACPGTVCEPIRTWAHEQLVREYSAIVVSARWATVDWSWPKEWTYCARTNLHFKKKKKAQAGREWWNSLPDARKRGKSPHCAWCQTLWDFLKIFIGVPEADARLFVFWVFFLIGVPEPNARLFGVFIVVFFNRSTLVWCQTLWVFFYCFFFFLSEYLSLMADSLFFLFFLIGVPEPNARLFGVFIVFFFLIGVP